MTYLCSMVSREKLKWLKMARNTQLGPYVWGLDSSPHSISWAGLSNMASLLPSVAPGLGWLRDLRNSGGRIDELLTWQLASHSEDSKKECSKRPR